MWLCAGLRLLGVPLLPEMPGSVGFPLEIGISWGVFALLAWGNGRGYKWARVLFAAWVALHSLVLFYDLAHFTASYSPAWTVIASVTFWLVELSAVLLILNRRSQPHYPAQACLAKSGQRPCRRQGCARAVARLPPRAAEQPRDARDPSRRHAATAHVPPRLTETCSPHRGGTSGIPSAHQFCADLGARAG